MTNPFFSAWSTPFEAPPFELIQNEHFRPAFEQAIAEHDAEIGEIADQEAAPGFENTIVALERSGKALRRVSMVFGQLTSAVTNPELQVVGPRRLFVASIDPDFIEGLLTQKPSIVAVEVNKLTVESAVRYVYGVDDAQKRFVSNHFGKNPKPSIMVDVVARQKARERSTSKR